MYPFAYGNALDTIIFRISEPMFCNYADENL